MRSTSCTSNAGTAGTASSLAAILGGWISRYLERRRFKATAYALNALDDRTLHDIGLTRGEIDSVIATRGSGRRHRIEIGGATIRS